jgi:DnaD/phage-associated family protein
MAWVSVHQQVRDHRKLRDLYRKLGVSRQEALGILVLIWTWAIDNCNEDVKLLSVTLEDISHAAYWTRGDNELYTALKDTGWIDEIEGDMYLHDWYDFNKPFYDFKDKKEKDKQRKIPRKFHGNSTEIPRSFQASQSPAPSPSQSPSQYIHNNIPAADEDVKKVCQLFKECKMGEVNGVIAGTIMDMVDNHPMELIEEAFRLAGLKNARSIKYPFKILVNWQAKGITTLEGAQKEQSEPAKQGLNKKLDFQKYPQHEYAEGELDNLFEKVGE